MRACKEYLEAPNPEPKPLIVKRWAMTDQRGRFRMWMSPKIPLLRDKKPDGSMEYERRKLVVWKPRMVRVTVEAI